MKLFIIGIIVVVGVLILTVNNIQKTQSAQVQPIVTEQPTNEAVKTIEVEAGSYYYKPNIITVKKGGKVKIIMRSVSLVHDFVIDELNVKMPLVKNGDTGTVEFTADKLGTFEYYCSVGQHRQLGMVGKLIVE